MPNQQWDWKPGHLSVISQVRRLFPSYGLVSKVIQKGEMWWTVCCPLGLVTVPYWGFLGNLPRAVGPCSAFDVLCIVCWSIQFQLQPQKTTQEQVTGFGGHKFVWNTPTPPQPVPSREGENSVHVVDQWVALQPTQWDGGGVFPEGELEKLSPLPATSGHRDFVCAVISASCSFLIILII